MKKKTTYHSEIAIIGTLITYPELFANADKTLLPDCFQDEGCKSIYTWMRQQSEQMRDWSASIVSSTFGDVSREVMAGDLAFFSSEVEYLRAERDKKHYVQAMTSAIAEIQLNEANPYEVSARVMESMSRNGSEDLEKTRSEKLLEAWKQIRNGVAVVPTVWPELDSMVGGYQEGQTVIIAGTPGTGKTHQALTMLLDLAKQGKSVLFCSIEMTETQVWQRLISIESGIGIDKMIGGMNAEQLKKATDALQLIGVLPFHVADVTKTTNRWSILRGVINQYIKDQAIQYYVVDYVQLLFSGSEKLDNSGNETKILSHIIKEVAAFNKARKLCGIFLSQFNRAVSQRSNPRPTKEDLRGTSALEDNADWILLFYRPMAHEQLRNSTKENGEPWGEYETEIIVAKNRLLGGRLGSFFVGAESSPVYASVPGPSNPSYARVEPIKQVDDSFIPF